jgi:hypothetical protein
LLIPQKQTKPRMRSQNRLLLVALLACALLLFTLWSMPFAVSNGLRLWLWWKARQQGLTVTIDKIDAPFLRPVVLRGLHIVSARDAACHIDASLARTTVGLDLNSILLRRSGSAIRTIIGNGLHIDIRSGKAPHPLLNEAGWQSLQALLPDSFNFEQVDLRVEDRGTVVLLRNVFLSGNEIEAGHFRVDQLVIASPWFRQTFAQLRGATKWEERRLTIAGLTLAPGIDLPSVTSDLSRLGHRAIGMDFDAEVFGGKIRANISHDWRSEGANWNLVSSASDISLAEAPQAIGFIDQLGGVIHACKFSFRGNLLDPAHATGWIWTELTALSWRERAADVVTFGAALSNGQIAVEQLYLKQNRNELTLTGETTMPTSLPNWMNLDFRVDVSASIADLDDFAGLFGANAGQFGGEISVAGTLNAREHKFAGDLSATGSALRVFNAPLDRLNAKMHFSGSQLKLEELELAHGQDFLQAQGKIDMFHDHAAHGMLRLSVRDLADYFPRALLSSSLAAEIIFDGRVASIKSLQLQDDLRHVGFNGTIDFGDLQNVGVTLVPAQLLLGSGWLHSADCVGAVQFFPAAEPNRFLSEIKRLHLRGNVLAGSWNITLEKEAGPDETISICREPSNRTLQLLIATEAENEFGAKALRSFQRGAGKPLSLPSDQP